MINDNFIESYSKQISKISSSSSSPRRTKNRLIFPPEYSILESPNHKTTVEINLKRIPEGSKALSPHSKILEKNWNSRFNVAFSKHNNEIYTKLREYFDSPRKIDEKPVMSNTNYRIKQPKRTYRRKTIFDEKESMWCTRYSASSEWNEVTHKTLRKYFLQDNNMLPKIT